MVSKILVALCVLVALASAIPSPPAAGGWGPGANPFIPPWVAAAIPSAPAAGAWGPPAGGANPFIPPWVASAPWFPQWRPCATIGSACVDCTTKAVCTPIGGMQKACTDPTLPYCNLGECSATPTTACAPVQAVPAAGTV